MSLRRFGGAQGGSVTSATAAGSSGALSGPSGCSSSALRGSMRTHMNGFSLFVKQLPSTKSVPTAGSLKEGQLRMAEAAKLWSALPKREKEIYNRQARAIAVVRHTDDEKKYNLFNLTMKLLAEANLFAVIGSGKLSVSIARETVRRLTPKAAQKLRHHFEKRLGSQRTKAHAQAVAGGTKPVAQVELHSSRADLPFSRAYHQFHFPSMRYFHSFTEMQRAVCPSAQSFFTCACLLERSNISRSTFTSTSTRFHLLPAAAQAIFSPITDEESDAFEAFCARPVHCAGQDPEAYNIVLMAALFRHLPVTKPPVEPWRVQLYHDVATVDRLRDGPFRKVQRCLLRARAQRSSDCGEFLHHEMPEDGVVVARGTYGVQAATSLADFEVATVLAHTRHGQSVYDDILHRAAALRPAPQQQLLKIYAVNTSQAERKAAVLIAPKVKPKQNLMQPVLDPAMMQSQDLANTRATPKARLEAAQRRGRGRPRKVQAAKRTRTTPRAQEKAVPARTPDLVARATPTTETLSASVAAHTTQSSHAVEPRASKGTQKPKTTKKSQRRTRQQKRTASLRVRGATDGPVQPVAAPPPPVPRATEPMTEMEWDEFDMAMGVDGEADDTFVLSANEEEVSAAAAATDSADVRHDAALAAIAALGLKPAKASQHRRATPITVSAKSKACSRDVVAKTKALAQRRSATLLSSSAAPTKAASRSPRVKAGGAAGKRTRAHRMVKSAAAAAAAAKVPVTTPRAPTSISATVTSTRARETREDRQRRVQRVLLSGKQQKILHGHHQPQAGAPGKGPKVRRSPGKPARRAAAPSPLTESLRAQFASMLR